MTAAIGITLVPVGRIRTLVVGPTMVLMLLNVALWGATGPVDSVDCERRFAGARRAHKVVGMAHLKTPYLLSPVALDPKVTHTVHHRTVARHFRGPHLLSP